MRLGQLLAAAMQPRGRLGAKGAWPLAPTPRPRRQLNTDYSNVEYPQICKSGALMRRLLFKLRMPGGGKEAGKEKVGCEWGGRHAQCSKE